MFLSKSLSTLLLFMHICGLALFARKWIRATKAQNNNASIFLLQKNRVGTRFNPEYIAYTMFLSNFIGIAFARTLHYQFYSWYFHAIPFLMWSTNLPFVLKVILFFAIEFAFNVFPATALSSIVLQVSHTVILLSLYFAKVPSMILPSEKCKKS